MVLVGGATMLALPITGTVTIHQSEHTADVLVRLARADERVRRALLLVLRYGTFLELLTVVGSIGLAVNVDFYLRTKGKSGVPPNNPAVQLLIGQEVNSVLAAAGQSGEPSTSANGQPVAGWATQAEPSASG